MTIQYTPIYQIPWPQPSDPIKSTQTTLEAQAKRLEVILQQGSFPASNPDVASITNRLNLLEGKTTLRHAEYTNTTNGFAVAGGFAQWDMGPQVVDSAKTFNNNFSTSAGTTPSGAVNITQSGLYLVSCIITPAGSPGNAGILLKDASSSISTGSTTGHVWEYSASFNQYLQAGSYIRGTIHQTNATTVFSRLRITKLA